MAYVKSALDEYPGIRVAVPSEVDDSTNQVLGTDISNEQLELVTKTQMEELGDVMAEDLLDKGAELAADSIPLRVEITTGVIEGRNLLAGRSTLQESLSRGARRIGKAAVYDAIGTVSGIGPGMIAVRVAESRISRPSCSRRPLGGTDGRTQATETHSALTRRDRLASYGGGRAGLKPAPTGWIIRGAEKTNDIVRTTS